MSVYCRSTGGRVGAADCERVVFNQRILLPRRRRVNTGCRSWAFLGPRKFWCGAGANHDGGVQPDLFVVPLVGGRPPRHFDAVRHLLLVVEVLSPSSGRADRVVKRTLYRDEHVDEYWIVDLDSRTIERSTPSLARPEILDARLEWLPTGAASPLAVDLTKYFGAFLDD
jgi:Uma2 family endonuclease